MKYKIGDGIRFIIHELEDAEKNDETPDQWLKRKGAEFNQIQSKTIIDMMEKDES